jgi:hypothetical protein
MNFKKFLEAPYYTNADIKVVCPEDHVIKLSDKTRFDYGLEVGKEKGDGKFSAPEGRQKELFKILSPIFGDNETETEIRLYVK